MRFLDVNSLLILLLLAANAAVEEAKSMSSKLDLPGLMLVVAVK